MKQNIKDFCKKNNLTKKQFLGKENVLGNLYLRNLTSIPDGFNPTVGGNLDLGNLTSIPDGFNPTVGGYLDLENLTSIPDGFNPTVGGYLYLRNLTSIPEGFNPTVGGNLYLENLTSIPEGFNPTVGGNLYLRNLTSIPEGFNPTVGGDLYLQNRLIVKTTKPKGLIKTSKNKLLSWKDGKYISADGLFTEVISKKGNVYKVKKINSDKELFLVTNGTMHSHGETIAKAKEDFRFKILSEKLKKEPITEDTIITDNYYRLVTGACELGVKQWREQNKITIESITAKELVPILEKTNAYGFEKFKQLISF